MMEPVTGENPVEVIAEIEMDLRQRLERAEAAVASMRMLLDRVLTVCDIKTKSMMSYSAASYIRQMREAADNHIGQKFINEFKALWARMTPERGYLEHKLKAAESDRDAGWAAADALAGAVMRLKQCGFPMGGSDHGEMVWDAAAAHAEATLAAYTAARTKRTT